MSKFHKNNMNEDIKKYIKYENKYKFKKYLDFPNEYNLDSKSILRFYHD